MNEWKLLCFRKLYLAAGAEWFGGKKLVIQKFQEYWWEELMSCKNEKEGWRDEQDTEEDNRTQWEGKAEVKNVMRDLVIGERDII